MRLVERTDEFALLRDILSGMDGALSRVVAVSGPVASGKSELLNFVVDRAESAGYAVLKATGQRAEQRTPMGVLGQLLLGSHLTPEESERVDKLLDDARFTAMLRDPDSEQEEHVRPHTMRSLTTPLVNLAQERPLVVVVDDVQYADIASLQTLQHALRELRTKPVVFVLARRTAPHRSHPLFGAELLRHPGLIHMSLTMLGSRGVEELLAQCLDDRTAHAMAAEVHRLSGGNPLLVRALVHDLPVDGMTRAVPVTGAAYQQAVLSCLYRAEPSVLAVARGLAVLEEAADPAILADLLDLDADTIKPCLRELAGIGLVDGGAFRSPAARDTVLDDLPAGERAALHRRAALLLRQEGAEAAVVARHLVTADDVVDAEFVDVLWEAAVRARTADEVALGIACLQLAGRSCGNGPRRSAILAELTRLTWRLRPSAICTPLRAMHSAFNKGWLGERELAMLVHHLLWQGRLGPAVDVIRKAQGAYGDQIAVDLGIHDTLRTVYPTLLDHLDLDMAEGPDRPEGKDVMAAPDQSVTGRASAALTAILTGNRAANCADTAEHILEGTRLRGSTLEALLQALHVLLCADRLETAAHFSEALLREAGKLGIPGWQAPLSAMAAQVALRRGNPAEAVRHAGNALMWMPPHAWGVAIGSLRATLIAAHTAMGQYEQAAEHLDQHAPDELPDTRFGLELRFARGQFYAAVGRSRPALEDFLACGDLMTRWGIDQPGFLPWRSAAAEMHLRAGRHAEAERLAREQLDRCRPGPSRTRALTLRVLAEASGLRRHHALLREAVEELEECEDRLELVRVLGALSRSYHALDELGQARMMARRAWHIARDIGAEALCSQQLLPCGEDETGSEPEALAGGGSAADELTYAERRVASLASFGHSNREIARKLYITVSTVEQHLTRVYRKLNVSRRKDLPHELFADMAS